MVRFNNALTGTAGEAPTAFAGVGCQAGPVGQAAQRTGGAGQTVDLKGTDATGDTTAFSTGMGTGTLVVTPVNDGPVMAPETVRQPAMGRGEADPAGVRCPTCLVRSRTRRTRPSRPSRNHAVPGHRPRGLEVQGQVGGMAADCPGRPDGRPANP